MPSPKVECPRCAGRGEIAVPGTYGATVSPELLETETCWLCLGDAEVSAPAARVFRDAEELFNDE